MQQLIATDFAAFAPSSAGSELPLSLFSPPLTPQSPVQVPAMPGWSQFGLWENGASDSSTCTTPEKSALSPFAPAFNCPKTAAASKTPSVADCPTGRSRSKQAKPGIGHEIDRWIASVTCSAPIAGPGVGCHGPSNIVLDKNTLLNFLSKLKMYHQKKREMRIELCVFCRQNQEPFQMYTSHRLTDALGNVTCPVLYQYVCPICSATGSKAHTIKYCPFGNGSQSSESTMAAAAAAVVAGARLGRVCSTGQGRRA